MSLSYLVLIKSALDLINHDSSTLFLALAALVR